MNFVRFALASIFIRRWIRSTWCDSRCVVCRVSRAHKHLNILILYEINSIRWQKCLNRAHISVKVIKIIGCTPPFVFGVWRAKNIYIFRNFFLISFLFFVSHSLYERRRWFRRPGVWYECAFFGAAIYIKLPSLLLRKYFTNWQDHVRI